MSLYYPQGAMTMRVRWEDFNSGEKILEDYYTMTVLARRLSVEINDYNEADTFSCDIDYKNFPFDPRCIRSVGVTIHLIDQKRIFSGNHLDLMKPGGDNKTFIGFADEEKITFDDDTRTVYLEGRDFTSLFLDAKRLNPEPIPLSRPIDYIIQDLVKEQQATVDIIVENRTDEDLPTLSELAPDFNPVTTNLNAKRTDSYWDIIQNIVAKAGLIAYIELDTLVITKPRNLYNRKNTKQFVYGYNIKTLEFGRKLGRQRGFNVKVVSLNIEQKKTVEALLPEEAQDEEFVSRFGGQRITIDQLDKDGKKIEPPKDAEFLTFRVADVASKDHLIKIGEKVYEELTRQEIEGSLMSYEMEIPEKQDNKTMLPVEFSKIRTGTPIEIGMEQDDMKKLGKIKNRGERAKFLIARGYPGNIADAFARSLGKVSYVFYTKSVTFTLDQSEGFEMDLKFINFIELDNKVLS